MMMGVNAQERYHAPKPGVKTLSAAPENIVSSSSSLLENTMKLQIGKRSAVLVGVINNSDEPVYLAGVRGSFHDPADYTKLLYNRSYGLEQLEIPASGGEASFTYVFYPIDARRALDATFTVRLFYTDPEGREFSDSAMNQTVSVVYQSSSIDLDLIKTVIILAIFFAAIGKYVYDSFKGYASSSRKSKKN